MMPLTDILTDKSILITGGTGSFGHAFVRSMLANARPRKVIVFSRDEQKHHAMQKLIGDPRARYFVGGVRDLSRLQLALRGVDFVVHAAAMKHVDLCEYNAKTRALPGAPAPEALPLLPPVRRRKA